MARLRRHLGVMTVAAVSLYAGVVTLGTFRGCWDAEHAHAGAAAPDCVMHHQTPADSFQHSHHDHDGSRQDGDQRLTCRCAGDPTTPHVGPSAIIAGPPAIIPVVPIVMLPGEGRPFRPDVLVSPPAPPPRAAFSSNS